MGLLGLFENSIFEKKTKATTFTNSLKPANITNRPKKYKLISTLPTKPDEKKKANALNRRFLREKCDKYAENFNSGNSRKKQKTNTTFCQK